MENNHLSELYKIRFTTKELPRKNAILENSLFQIFSEIYK